ncbi:hypothetical protein CFC21_070820 [Triticum aestivum]|uniref:rRNA N-glycosidase n=2 Tax=Triticum aestivum TaxID=4565 RepID=A0A9R1KSA2_WHEAT|nr:uncharacterized protein LOC123111164 [Triticum aestivum]KAF7064522.1 hypothetical protein CFC21_070820 [Triticum aestivum]
MGRHDEEQKRMFKKRDLAEKKASETAKKNRPNQDSYEKIIIHRLSIDATSDEILGYYRSVRATFSTVSSFVVRVSVRLPGKPQGPFDDGGVPVTSPPPQEAKDFTYQITELFDPLTPNGPVIQIAVQQFSGYAMAVRALYLDNDPFLQAWYAFRGAELQLPKHLFPNVISFPYRVDYDDVNAIHIHPEILREVYEYFVTYQTTAVELALEDEVMEHTIDGQTYKDTVFFLIGECQRFFELLELTWNAFALPPSGFLLSEIPYANLLIHRWRHFSEAIEKLWLAIFEERNDLPFEVSRASALNSLKKLEALFPEINFKNERQEYCVEVLAGSTVQLLNCDLPTIKKVLMRSDGFCGEFFVQKNVQKKKRQKNVQKKKRHEKALASD